MLQGIGIVQHPNAFLLFGFGGYDPTVNHDFFVGFGGVIAAFDSFNHRQ